MTLVNLAWTLWLVGHPDAARERIDQGLAQAREIGHPFTLAAALVWAGFVHSSRGEWPQVLAATEEVSALARQHDISYWPIIATIQRGRAEVEEGRLRTGMRQIDDGVAAYRRTGSGVVLAYLLALKRNRSDAPDAPTKGSSESARASTSRPETEKAIGRQSCIASRAGWRSRPRRTIEPWPRWRSAKRSS